MLIETLKEQLKDYCDCNKDITDKDVEETINLVSLATCWDFGIDYKPREENFKVKNLHDIVKFTPKYMFYDTDTFEFTLVEIKGVKVKATAIDKFSFYDGVFRLELPHTCKCDKCHCEPPKQYEIKVRYYAGLKSIPEMYLPVFCDVLALVQAKNNCACDSCESCGGNRTTNVDNLVEYASGDYISATLQNENLKDLLVNNYMNQLHSLSLCELKSKAWGEVIC